MNTILSVAAALVVIALIVVRRAQPKPIAEESLRKPLILAAVGLFLLRDVVLDAPSVAFLVLTACVALGLGAARGAKVRIQRQGTRLLSSWGPACFALMGALVVVRLGLDAGAVSLGVASAVVGQSILFALGLSLLAESAVVGHRTGRGVLQTSIR